MDVFFTILAYAGLAVVLIQAWPYFFSYKKSSIDSTLVSYPYPLVSIIIPARNEEKSLHLLLESLLKLSYPHYEIIVIDDQSEDNTYERAAKYPITLVKAPPKPPGWVGKSWACHIGTRFAKGDLLLFTDADTIHIPDSLIHAVSHFKQQHASLLSAPSFHINKYWWEKLMGSFHFLVSIAVTPYNTPSPKNPYAIGQYLLFDSQFYNQIGGHSAIRNSLAEDVDLARKTILSQGIYRIYTDTVLYQVQMYNCFNDFIKGWRRLLTLGLQFLDISCLLISVLTIFTLTSFLAEEGGILRWIPTLGVLACMWGILKKSGNYSVLSLLLFPLSSLLFILLGLQALGMSLLKIPIQWRGRVYKQTAHT